MMNTPNAIERRRREQAATPTPDKRSRRSHEQRSAETQSALVEAAIAMLREVGYAGVTTAAVARRAGCTTGAMHHHFGSKEELMLAVLTRLSLEFEALYPAFKLLADLPLSRRCEKVVEMLADYYIGARYVAIWELYVGTRCERSLNELCVKNRKRVISKLESVWLQIFADVAATRADLVALLRFTLTFLRSLGLDHTLGTDSGATAAQREILRAILMERISASSSARKGGRR
jgi:AcrR family transcriptional regulator